jgi:hypothetical protein
MVHLDVRRPEGKREQVFRYETVLKHGLTFIHFPDAEREDLLALYSDSFMLLYEGEGERPVFRGDSDNPRSLEAMHLTPREFSASSYLTEGDVEYLPSNLGRFETRSPWVEGAPGPGVGEVITMRRGFSRFWISSGFVSYRRPELYTMNGRPKVIHVVDVNTGDERTVELADTPNPQPVRVPGESGEAREFRLTVEEVYPGSRWEDTCINFILYY